MKAQTLNSIQLQELAKDLADVAQHYHRSPDHKISLRQYKTDEDGGEVLYVVGEDEHGKEWIVVKVALTPPMVDELCLKIDLCQKPTDTKVENSKGKNKRHLVTS